MSRRIQRVNELIAQEVGKIISEELSEDFGMIDVSTVESSKDLKHADVWISVFDAKKADSVVKNLQNLSREIQSMLSKKLTMKYIPNLKFHIDKSGKNLDKVDKLLEQIKNES